MGLTLDEATGEPITLPLAGREVRVKPRTLADLAELQAWFKREIPSPLLRAMETIDQAKGLGIKVSPATADMVVAAAQRSMLAWPPRVWSWAWRDAVDQAGKAGYLVWWALQPTHPEIDQAEAERLTAEATGEQVATLACVVFEGRLPDPKEMPGTIPAATMSPTPSPSGTTGPDGSTTFPLPEAGPTG